MPTTFLKNPVSVNVPSTAEGLNVSGIPAAATSGGGAQPSNTLTVQGTAGQDTTGSAQTAGAGANVSITAGTGGAAPSGSTNGAGGSVTINPGTPGTGGGTAGAHGNILMATAGGKIGIGMTTPTVKLDVNGAVAVSNNNAIYFRNASGAADASIREGGGGNLDIVAPATGNIFFSDHTDSMVNMVVGDTGLRVSGSVQVGAPIGGDMGAGSINVSGDIYKNGAPREPQGIFARQDLLQEKLEELTKRIGRLEAALAKTTTTKKKKKTSGKERR